MKSPSNKSDTIFTSPLKCYRSRQLQQLNISSSNNTSPNQSPRYQNRDYQTAIDFAEFIGLSSTNKIKKRTISNVDKFFQSKNLLLDNKSQNQKSNSKSFIQNDLLNRKINFFDLKNLYEQRKKSLQLQKHKNQLQQKMYILQNQVKLKDSRIKSARNVRVRNGSLLENWPLSDGQDDDGIEKLRVRTAKQLSKRQKLNRKKNEEKQRFIKQRQIQKQRRSKILLEISKNQIENPEKINNQIFMRGCKQCKQCQSLQRNQILIKDNQKQQNKIKYESKKKQKKDINKIVKVEKLTEKQQPQFLNIRLQIKGLINLTKNFQQNQNKSKDIKKLQEEKYIKCQNLRLRYKKQTNKFEYSFK